MASAEIPMKIRFCPKTGEHQSGISAPGDYLKDYSQDPCDWIKKNGYLQASMNGKS
ncbi:MAG: hypothetical protein ACREBQ_14215 [Nitrososphaerales archaeon]